MVVQTLKRDVEVYEEGPSVPNYLIAGSGLWVLVAVAGRVASGTALPTRPSSLENSSKTLITFFNYVTSHSSEIRHGLVNSTLLCLETHKKQSLESSSPMKTSIFLH